MLQFKFWSYPMWRYHSPDLHPSLVGSFLAGLCWENRFKIRFVEGKYNINSRICLLHQGTKILNQNVTLHPGKKKLMQPIFHWMNGNGTWYSKAPITIIHFRTNKWKVASTRKKYLSRSRRGQYRKQTIPQPVSIAPNPNVFTRDPLRAGPERNTNYNWEKFSWKNVEKSVQERKPWRAVEECSSENIGHAPDKGDKGVIITCNMNNNLYIAIYI